MNLRQSFIRAHQSGIMEKEDVDRLLEIATRSRIHSVLVGILMLAAGIVFALYGVHAIVLEITVTGILMIVFGTNAFLNQGIRSADGIPMVVLGVLFVTLTFIFEAIHGLLLFLEFLSTGVVSLAVAVGERKGRYGRRKSLAIGIVSLYVAANLLVAHEESMDILVTLMGYFLIVLAAYVLWCAATGRQVENPLPGDGE